MEWNIFWEAFGAIGTTIGSLITAIAVVVAVVQYRQPITKKIKITTGTSIPVYDNRLGDNYFCITIANIGVRPIIISNVYLNAGKKNLVINNLMEDFISNDGKIHFPKELSAENTVEIFISHDNLVKSFTKLLSNKEIYRNQKLKVLVSDTTGRRYFAKTGLTPNRIKKHMK